MVRKCGTQSDGQLLNDAFPEAGEISHDQPLDRQSGSWDGGEGIYDGEDDDIPLSALPEIQGFNAFEGQEDELEPLEDEMDDEMDDEKENHQGLMGFERTREGEETVTTGEGTSARTNESTPRPASTFFLRPACTEKIRADLLGDYVLGPKPQRPPEYETLSKAQELSLQHYIAWRSSNGTVRAYNEHRKVLQAATGIEILSLYLV